MKCPFCKTSLVAGEEKRYETTAEHVFDPNMETHPLRPTFVCPANCELSVDTFWDETGGWYMGRNSVDYGLIMEWKKENGESTAALGSWDRWHDEQMVFARRLIWLLGYGRAYNLAGWIFRWFEPQFRYKLQ